MSDKGPPLPLTGNLSCPCAYHIYRPSRLGHPSVAYRRSQISHKSLKKQDKAAPTGRFSHSGTDSDTKLGTTSAHAAPESDALPKVTHPHVETVEIDMSMIQSPFAATNKVVSLSGTRKRSSML